MITAYEFQREWRDMVEELEDEGATTSDAQGAADAALFIKHGVYELDVMRQDQAAWIAAYHKIEAEDKA